METFVIRDQLNGILIPLADLVGRLPRIAPIVWAFRNVKFQSGAPFGLSLSEFERLAHELEGGFLVADADFRRFLTTEFQIIDGEIDAIGPSGPLLHIDCEDATQWEISTEDQTVAARLAQSGFVRSIEE